MYDHPYRMELARFHVNGQAVYEVYRTGEGVICSGTNWFEMRGMVNAANAALTAGVVTSAGEVRAPELWSSAKPDAPEQHVALDEGSALKLGADGDRLNLTTAATDHQSNRRES